MTEFVIASLQRQEQIGIADQISSHTIKSYNALRLSRYQSVVHHHTSKPQIMALINFEATAMIVQSTRCEVQKRLSLH